MVNVIGVRFKTGGKLYYFDPGEMAPNISDRVLVETARGREVGEVIMPCREVSEESVVTPLRPIVRMASEEDLERDRQNREREKEVFAVCQEKIALHKLDMKLVRAEIGFDNNKILFYFTANGRVDFRALVKDLAAQLHSRIELRQIGVRDEARMIGGLGPCGRPICCDAFLADFEPVSIKMAKEQKLSLNPTKISGVCGRLMCCLKFEEDHYEATHRRMPRPGKEIQTPDGIAIVADMDVLHEIVTCRFVRGEDMELRTYTLDELVAIGSAKPYVAPGESTEAAEAEGANAVRQEEAPAAEEKQQEAPEITEAAGNRRREGRGGRRTPRGGARTAPQEPAPAGKADARENPVPAAEGTKSAGEGAPRSRANAWRAELEKAMAAAEARK